jgi:hypothetical protein
MDDDKILTVLQHLSANTVRLAEIIERMNQRMDENALALAQAIGDNTQLLAKGIGDNSRALAEILARVGLTSGPGH